MATQFWFLFGAIAVASGLLVLANVVYILWDAARTGGLELLFRIMAIFGAVFLVSVSVVGGKPIPTLLADFLLEGNPFSFTVLLYGWVLPAAVGVGMGILLLSIIRNGTERSIRILTFVNFATAVFTMYSLLAVRKSLPEYGVLAEKTRLAIFSLGPNISFLGAVFIYLVLFHRTARKRATTPNEPRARTGGTNQ